MTKVEKIAERIEQLLHKAQLHQHFEQNRHQPIYDKQLFSQQGKSIAECIKETQAVFETLKSYIHQPSAASECAQYLANKLLNQMTAIEKTLNEDTATFSNENNQQAQIRQLSEQLRQHQEWERRLLNMVEEAELNYEQSHQSTYAQQKLNHVQSRLRRCQQAKLVIEKNIHYIERKT
jgi:primosomal replication protein N''